MSIFWFILGTIIGSFLNVCIYRLPLGKSIVFPPSHCINCGKRLSVLDLIPILGYFTLKGKCRYCGEKISLRYPLVELITGTAFAGLWVLTGGEAIPFIFQAVFVAVLLVIFFIDLEHQVIPDVLNIIGVAAGLLYSLMRWMLFSGLLGMLLGYGILYLISWAGKLWFKKEAVGEGDLYMAAFLGAYLGREGVLLAIFLAYLVAAIISVALLVMGKVKLGQYVPFG